MMLFKLLDRMGACVEFACLSVMYVGWLATLLLTLIVNVSIKFAKEVL